MAGRESARADEMAVPLDLLLTTSATGVARRMMPDASWSRFGLNLASQPSTVAERVGSLGRELVSITRGTSDRAPAKADKRFSDPAWQGNPLMKRSMQAYLAANETVDKLFSDAHLSWRDAEQMRIVLDVVMEGPLPQQQSVDQSAGLEGDDRHRWPEPASRCATFSQRHGVPRPGSRLWSSRTRSPSARPLL